MGKVKRNKISNNFVDQDWCWVTAKTNRCRHGRLLLTIDLPDVVSTWALYIFISTYMAFNCRKKWKKNQKNVQQSDIFNSKFFTRKSSSILFNKMIVFIIITYMYIRRLFLCYFLFQSTTASSSHTRAQWFENLYLNSHMMAWHNLIRVANQNQKHRIVYVVHFNALNRQIS